MGAILTKLGLAPTTEITFFTRFDLTTKVGIFTCTYPLRIKHLC